MLKWVVQDRMSEDLIQALSELNQDYDVVTVIPFANEIIPDVNYEFTLPVIAMGSDSLLRLAKNKNWVPGAFTNDNFDVRIWLGIFGEKLLNHDSKIYKFGEIPAPVDNTSFFIRPVYDLKIFAGNVVDSESFSSWQNKAVAYGDTLNYDTPVAIAPPKRIYEEYRFFVVDGKIITQSRYKIGHKVIYSKEVNIDAINFAERMINIWVPDTAFVMDVAHTPDGYKVIEFNSINASGFYACDIKKIILALNELVNNKFS